MMFIVKRAVRLRLLTERIKDIASFGKFFTLLMASGIAFCSYVGLVLLFFHMFDDLRYLIPTSYIANFFLVAAIVVFIVVAKSRYYEETRAYVAALDSADVKRIAKKDTIFVWIWVSMYILSSVITVIKAM
ncbi:MAG: hypothetical protein PUD36_07615 [Bacteroidales bacterium]|nr:hypothetical protein [Bacteroidales bacterium]